MGTPTESTWPGVSSYTNYNEYKGFHHIYYLFISLLSSDYILN